MYRLKIVINCLDFCRIYYLYIYILLWSNFVIDLVLITHFFVAMASRGGKKNETSGSVVQFRLASRRTLLVYIPPSITVDTMKLRDYNGNFYGRSTTFAVSRYAPSANPLRMARLWKNVST